MSEGFRGRHGARGLLRCSCLGIVAIALIAAAGCTVNSRSERVVFRLVGEQTSGPAHTAELINIVTPFTNLTDEPVHLTRISLASPMKSERLIGSSVYDARRLGFLPLLEFGNLPVECPKKFIPARVGSLVVQPHKFSSWFGVVTIRIMRPGKYVLGRLRIDYSTPSGNGWQYQNVNITLTVSDPPLPGPKPVPRNQVCPTP